MKIGLISCTKKKQNHICAAKKLYSKSTLFNNAWGYAFHNYDKTFILSAKHGLLFPNQRIEPYEKTLNKMNKKERLEWAGEVITHLIPLLNEGDIIYFHTGLKYREFLIPALTLHGFKSVVPLKGLPLGKQLQWYSRQDPDKTQLKLM